MRYLLLTLLFLGGCVQQKPKTQNLVIDATYIGQTNDNSIYFWKTKFQLNDHEKQFIQSHDIKRVYVRFFDIVIADEWESEQVIPIATTSFKEKTLSTLEIIPTIYITIEALRKMDGYQSEFAEKIVTRLWAMVECHNIPNIRQVQIDCDWTTTTRDIYFGLCDKIRELLHSKGVCISSTIRLHQLKEETPPVDRGVLMLYNTGAIKSIQTENSILDFKSVEPYLRGEVNYGIPLDFAYPTFSWGVWFRGGKFMAILRTSDYSNANHYSKHGKSTFTVTRDHLLENHQLQKGDIIRLENSHYDQISKVKQLVEQKLKQESYSVIIYHLDSANLSKYKYNEIQDIFSHN